MSTSSLISDQQSIVFQRRLLMDYKKITEFGYETVQKWDEENMSIIVAFDKPEDEITQKETNDVLEQHQSKESFPQGKGRLALEYKFDYFYPKKAPKVRFIDAIPYHCNVYVMPER